MIADQELREEKNRSHWPVLFLLSLATAIELIDGTALNISLPTIASDFNINLGTAFRLQKLSKKLEPEKFSSQDYSCLP